MVSYATVDQFKDRSQLDIDLSDAQESVVEDMLEAISRKIDHYCRRPDNSLAAPDVESYQYYEGTGENWLRIKPAISVSEVSVRENYLDVAFEVWESPTTAVANDGDWYPASGDPRHPLYNTPPYDLVFVFPDGDYTHFTKGQGIPTVRVQARWGLYTTAPADIREACLAQAVILYKRFQGSMASSLGTSDLTVLSVKVRLGALTRDVTELLDNGNWVLPLYGGQW